MKGNSGNRCLAVGIILLFVGTCIVPSISASVLSNEDFDIYISAGVVRTRWGRFGLGYSIVIFNKGDVNIEGIFSVNHTTLSGEKLLYSSTHFTIGPRVEIGEKSFTLIDFHPINCIFFTVIVEDVVVTKSGYEIGPFVFLLKS